MTENGEKIEKWWESKLTFMIGAITPLIVILAFLFSMKTDIALIQQSVANINTNHETHIQDILQDIKEIQDDQKIQNNQIIELQKQVLLILNKK